MTTTWLNMSKFKNKFFGLYTSYSLPKIQISNMFGRKLLSLLKLILQILATENKK